MRISWLGRLAACVLAAAAAHTAVAQINSGMITGIVTDPQKAVVPNAKVEAVEDATKFSHSAVTNGSGEFTMPYLKAGVYTLTVTALGFPVTKVTGLNVVTEGTVRADVALQLSKVSTEVEVLATVDQVQSDSTTVEGAVDDHLIGSIPNGNQNPLYYASLLAGVVGRSEMASTTSFQSFGIGYDGRRWQSAINVGGAAAFSASIQLDGLNVTSGAWNEASVLPNVDSLQEVRVVTNNFTAEQSRGMGAIKMSTKSGTNQWHGTVHDIVRNEDLNANTFSNNTNSIKRGQFRVNNFGGTIGGPVIKDKLFIFTSIDFMLHSDTPQWLWTVPTAQQRIGDFSQTMVSGTNGVATPVGIFDPNNVVQTSATVYTRAPYPGNVIPNPSPYALKIMSVYPLPNRPAIDAFGDQNFYTQATRTFWRSNNNNRLDYRRGRHSIYASGGVSIGHVDTPSPFSNPQWFSQPTTNSGGTPARNVADDNPYVQLGDTVILSPTLVLDLRAGVNRIHSNSVNLPPTPFTSADYTALGIPLSVQQIMPQFGAAPDLSPGFYSNAAWAQYSGKQERQTNSSATGSITKMHGKWQLKAGAEYRVYEGNYTDFQFNAADYQTSTGGYTVQNITAAGASTNNNNINQQGFSGANVLSGGGGWLIPATPSSRPSLTAKYVGLFTQNDWRATSRLTLNIGMRWELQPGPTDRFNRSSAMDLALASPFTASGNPLSTPYMGQVVFPGNNGLSRNLWNTTWTDFGPRLGAAYRLNEKGTWVLRGGYGIAYAPNNTGWYDGPFCYNQGAFTYSSQILPYGTNPNGTLVGPFWNPAVSPIITPPGPNSAAAQNYGTGGAYFNVNSEIPARVQMWNVFIERQLSRTWFVSVGLSGMHAVHLFESRYPVQNNQMIPANVLSAWRQTYISTNAGTNTANLQVQNPLQSATGTLLPFLSTLGQRTIPESDLYYPYLPLLGQTIQADNGQSMYNSLQVSVRHSFSNGFLLNGHYTWSKSIDNAYTELQDAQSFSDTTTGGAGGSNGYLNLLDDNQNKKLSYSDVPHRFVITGTYELPFGKGKHFDVKNRVARAAMGGWRIGSVYTWQMGFPLSPTGLNSSSLDNRSDRNPAPNEPLVLPSNLQGWYNGKTSVTLPDGRSYTPCAQCYLKFNPDAFFNETLTTANGGHQTNLFWWGNAAIDYGGLRGPGRNNMDVTLSRDFSIRERYVVSFNANVTNALNHTQFGSGTYNMALGSVQVSAVPATGIAAGESQNPASYGTHNLNTFDPRQVMLEMRVRF